MGKKPDSYKRLIDEISRKNKRNILNNFSDISDLIFSPIKNPKIEGNIITVENIRVWLSNNSKK